MAAFACWHMTLFVGVVPVVVLYLLASLCIEEGWREILQTPPGRTLTLMILFSAASTATWTTSGWHFLRRRGRQGLVHLLAAIVTGLLSGVMMAMI